MKLVIIGDGAERARLEALVKEGELEFKGVLPHATVQKEMGESKALVLPSECYEGMPMTLLEGFASATPCVVSDLGPLPEMVKEGAVGEVFKAGDVDSLVAALKRLLERKDYPEMCAAARREAETKYSEKVNYRRLQEIYGGAKRVLLVHNYYGSSAPSGENQVFEAEKVMLEKHGVEVRTFIRQSDTIRNGGKLRRLWGMVKGAASTIGNPFAAVALRREIRAFHPEVVHFHNVFPLISPLGFRAAHRAGARVILTLHNYRTVCAAGIPMREGRVCTDCFSGCVASALRHRCYRGSLFATAPLAANIALYRRRLAKWVDRFIALSEFQRGKMAACGFPAEKVVVKPNFVKIVDEKIVSPAERKDEILYVGRLSPEKGVHTLLKAWMKLAKNVGGGG